MKVLFCNIAWMREYTGNEDGKEQPGYMERICRQNR